MTEAAVVESRTLLLIIYRTGCGEGLMRRKEVCGPAQLDWQSMAPPPPGW